MGRSWSSYGLVFKYSVIFEKSAWGSMKTGNVTRQKAENAPPDIRPYAVISQRQIASSERRSRTRQCAAHLFCRPTHVVSSAQFIGRPVSAVPRISLPHAPQIHAAWLVSHYFLGRSIITTSERSCIRSRTTSRPSGEMSKSRMSKSEGTFVNCRATPVSKSKSQIFLC